MYDQPPPPTRRELARFHAAQAARSGAMVLAAVLGAVYPYLWA